LANILTKTPEPTEGILWANIVNFTSPKFFYSSFFLTLILQHLREAGESGTMDFFEIGAGFGSVPRMLAAAKQDLSKEGFNIRRYTILDVRPIINLQRWYLNKTLGASVELRDWHTELYQEQLLREHDASWGPEDSMAQMRS
ncbi:unnamed protein product, partial [Polarella glacialis]